MKDIWWVIHRIPKLEWSDEPPHIVKFPQAGLYGGCLLIDTFLILWFGWLRLLLLLKTASLKTASPPQDCLLPASHIFFFLTYNYYTILTLLLYTPISYSSDILNITLSHFWNFWIYVDFWMWKVMEGKNAKILLVQLYLERTIWGEILSCYRSTPFKAGSRRTPKYINSLIMKRP